MGEDVTIQHQSAGATRRLGVAWLALTAAVAVHVWDEAANDFLNTFYNPTVAAVREQFPWFPAPEFTYGAWLSGLIFGVVMLGVMAVPVFAGWRGMIVLAYIYGAIMLLNGLGHTAMSLATASFVPGVYSSPLLLAASVWLLVCARRAAK